MVKIEPVWEEMENSCSLRLGAREADGQARTWTGNSGIGSSEHTPSFARLQRSEPVRWERSMESCSAASLGGHKYNALPVCINKRGKLEVWDCLGQSSIKQMGKLRSIGKVFP